MAQALHIANGDTLNTKLAAKGNAVEKLLASGRPDAQIVEEAYLTALSRPPATPSAPACSRCSRRRPIPRKNARCWRTFSGG